jgi:7-keto-8-aminopelargonate synthetase-like enzyme
VTTPDPATLVAAAIYELAIAVGPYPEIVDLMRRHGAAIQTDDSHDTMQVGYFLECVAGP